MSHRDIGREAQAFRDQIGRFLVSALVAILVGQAEQRGRGTRPDETGEAAPGALEDRGETPPPTSLVQGLPSLEIIVDGHHNMRSSRQFQTPGLRQASEEGRTFRPGAVVASWHPRWAEVL